VWILRLACDFLIHPLTSDSITETGALSPTINSKPKQARVPETLTMGRVLQLRQQSKISLVLIKNRNLLEAASSIYSE
jgi:hypothetical protein